MNLKRKREQPEDDDEAPLSHAEKRRQKKKEKLDAQEKEKPKLETLPKRQNSVWVGNLLYKTTADGLRSFFDGVGEVTRIHMPLKSSSKPGAKPENRGFAYVDFATPEAKGAAIARSEQPLFGRKLLIKDGDDFTRRDEENKDESVAPKSLSRSAQKILRAQKQPPGPTLFLGNLSFNTTEDSIRQLFNSHRDKKITTTDDDPWIKKVRMGTFEDTGNCKGFAFIDFSTTENATSALLNPKNHHLDGRDLVVEYASPEAVRRGASKPKPSGEEVSSLSEKERKKAKYDKESRPLKFSQRKKPVVKHLEATDEDAGNEQVHEGEKKPKRLIRPMSGKRALARPKPGAALAMAKRQSVAIVPTQGPNKKITF